jgi:CRISPR-associated protein (TIGR02584 family)
MTKPSEYQRRILLAVSGLTPQIATETLYALAVSANEKFVPTEVHLISSQEGATRAKLLLLSKNPGWFHRLCHEYGLEGIQFLEENIHVLTGREMERLVDIRTAEDNQFAADFITNQVRHLTSDPRSALHVSLAGGRKTMGFYAGYALSLFGREQDRLSHVLAPEEFEFASEFFYPTRNRHVIEGKDKRPLDTSEATLMLAEIPFVRMRHGLPEMLLNGATSYSMVVNAANETIGPPELTIDLAGGRIQAGGKIISLPRASLALLSLFARRAMKGEAPIEAPSKYVKDEKWKRLYQNELRKTVQNYEDVPEGTRKSIEKGMDGDQFSMHLSRLQKALRKALGPQAAPYLIDNGRRRPRQYSSTLPASAIHYAAFAVKDSILAGVSNTKSTKSKTEKRGETHG